MHTRKELKSHICVVLMLTLGLAFVQLVGVTSASASSLAGFTTGLGCTGAVDIATTKGGKSHGIGDNSSFTIEAPLAGIVNVSVKWKTEYERTPCFVWCNLQVSGRGALHTNGTVTVYADARIAGPDYFYQDIKAGVDDLVILHCERDNYHRHLPNDPGIHPLPTN